MSIDELRSEAVAMTHWERHRFFALVAGVIMVALFLVSVAMSLYSNSGAAQLDLSRPGYKDIRAQAKRETTTAVFPSTGVLDKDAFNEFSKLYKDRASKVSSVDSFEDKALSEDSLQLMADPKAVDTETAGGQ